MWRQVKDFFSMLHNPQVKQPNTNAAKALLAILITGTLECICFCSIFRHSPWATPAEGVVVESGRRALAGWRPSGFLAPNGGMHGRQDWSPGILKGPCCKPFQHVRNLGKPHVQVDGAACMSVDKEQAVHIRFVQIACSHCHHVLLAMIVLQEIYIPGTIYHR